MIKSSTERFGVTERPYQEFLQVLPSSLSRSKNDNGDHGIRGY